MAVALLLLCALGGARVLQGAASQCACNLCCTVASRPPSMRVRDETHMCGLRSAEAEGLDEATCPSQCAPDPAIALVSSSAGEMDYNRYCFNNCKPGQTNELGAACEDLSAMEKEELRTAGGNAKDQAVLSEPEEEAAILGPEEAPQASDEGALEEAAQDRADQEAAAAVDTRAGLDGGKIVAEAAGKQAIAAGLDARLSEAEAKSSRLYAESTAALNAARSNARQIQEQSAAVRSSEVQAAIYSKSALRSLAEARKDLDGIRKVAQTAAKEAGAEAAAEMNAEADASWAKVAELRAKFEPKGPGFNSLAEAANRAAAPFYASMQRAMGVRMQYIDKAQQLAATAGDLQRNARILSTQAVQYRAAGSPMAANMMSTAKGMLADAASMDAEAQKWQAVAQSITGQIPTYQVAAGAAAARAATLANPAGQPPPTALVQAEARRLRQRARQPAAGPGK